MFIRCKLPFFNFSPLEGQHCGAKRMIWRWRKIFWIRMGSIYRMYRFDTRMRTVAPWIQREPPWGIFINGRKLQKGTRRPFVGGGSMCLERRRIIVDGYRFLNRRCWEDIHVDHWWTICQRADKSFISIHHLNPYRIFYIDNGST